MLDLGSAALHGVELAEDVRRFLGDVCRFLPLLVLAQRVNDLLVSADSIVIAQCQCLPECVERRLRLKSEGIEDIAESLRHESV